MVSGPTLQTSSLSGGRNHTPPCSSEELLFAESNGGHKGKVLVVDIVPWFYKVFVSTTGWPEQFSNDFLSMVVVYAVFFHVKNQQPKVNKVPETSERQDSRHCCKIPFLCMNFFSVIAIHHLQYFLPPKYAIHQIITDRLLF